MNTALAAMRREREGHLLDGAPPAAMLRALEAPRLDYTRLYCSILCYVMY